VLILFVPIILD